MGCSPWGREESDTTEQLHFHFSLSCIGEGIGNPLQCSCLENPRGGGACWAAVSGVAQSQTRLKRQQQQQTFSFSSSTNICMVVIKTNFTIVIVSDRERGEENRFGVPGNLYNISEV